jgi:hypothetical protein
MAAAFGLRFALPDYLIDMYKSLKSKRSGAPTLRSGCDGVNDVVHGHRHGGPRA